MEILFGAPSERRTQFSLEAHLLGRAGISRWAKERCYYSIDKLEHEDFTSSSEHEYKTQHTFLFLYIFPKYCIVSTCCVQST